MTKQDPEVKKPYRDYLDRAEHCVQQGQLKQAVATYRLAIKEHPGKAAAHYGLAVLHHKMGELGKSLLAFRKAAELEPGDASVFHNMGVIEYKLNRVQRAANLFKRAIEIEPTYPDPHYALAKIYADKKLVYDACELLRTCVALRPEWKKAEELLETLWKRRNDPEINEKYRRILIVMDQGIGNMVMLTPTIRALKEQLPGVSITILGRQPSVGVVEGWELVDRVVTELDASKYDVGFLTIWSQDYDRLYGERIRNQCRTVYTYRIDNLDVHESDYHLKIARMLGYEGSSPDPYCASDDPGLALPGGKKIIGLSDTTLDLAAWQRKRWPYYQKLAERLQEQGHQVVLIGGKTETERFDPKTWSGDVINACGKYDLRQTAGLIKRCDLFVGNDSGPAHVAAALGVPTYVIFGPTRIGKNKPLGTNVISISKHLPCSPCQYTQRWARCLNWRCMTELSVGEVLAEINRELIASAEETPSMTCEASGSKKMLIVGVLDVPSSTNVFMKKGFERLGCSVDAYNYRTRARQLGSAKAMWADFREFLNDKAYDLILFSKVNGLHPDLIEHTGHCGKTWYWFMDNLAVAQAIGADKYAKAAHFVSATSQEVCHWLQHQNPNTEQIIEGFDPETYFKEDLAKIHDLLFVGNATEQRIETLTALRNGKTVAVFGDGWPEIFHPGPAVHNEELRKTICQSKIILNLVHSNIFSDRVVLTAASGGFVLSQACPDLKRHFGRRKHLDWFESVDEARELITHYLEDDDEREQIAAQGMRHVRNKYTWESVCREILEKSDQSTRRARAGAQKQTAKRVLFVSWHGLGDNVMLTPALRKYKQLNPETHIAVAGLQRFGNTLTQLLSGLPFIDEVIPCLPDAWNDFADYNSGVEATVKRAQELAADRGFSEVVELPTKRQQGYKLHKIFRFADEVGVRFDSLAELQTELAVSQEVEQRAEDFLEGYNKPILVLHTKGGNDAKTLPSNFVEQFLGRYDGHSVFEFGRQSTVRSILVDENDMEFSKALIKRADFVVAIDSVVMHIAGAFRRPLVAIFTHTPIHQAIPLTYPVDIVTNQSQLVQEQEYLSAKREIERVYTKRTSESDEIQQYLNIQHAVEEEIHLEVADYGPQAQRFLDIVWRRLPTQERLPSYPEKALILDVGCNTGYNTKRLAEKYGGAIGIDINTRLIDRAKKHNWPQCYQMDMHQMSFKEDMFDLVFAKDVLEHAYDPDRALSECFRVLKPGGFVVGLIPMDGNGKCTIGLSQGNLSHYWKTNSSDCENRIEKSGFVDIEIFKHSHRELVNRERPFGDEILVFVAQKPAVEKLPVRNPAIRQKVVLPSEYYQNSYWAQFLLYQCPGKCPFCIIHGRGHAPTVRMMSADKIVKFWNSVEHPTDFRFSLLGGEPTLRSDFLDIVNNLEGYFVTMTSNLGTPFFEDSTLAKRIKPKSILRINTTFHPHFLSADKFIERLKMLLDLGLYIDQIDMVDHPDVDYQYWAEEFAAHGIKLGYAPFLGFYRDGKFPCSSDPEKSLHSYSERDLFPNESRRDFEHTKRKCGIEDFDRFRKQCGVDEKKAVMCDHHRYSFLVAPDGRIYRCHYLMYYTMDPIGHVDRIGELSRPQAEECRHFGFCNWCDIPRITYRINGVNTPQYLALNGFVDDFEMSRREIAAFKQDFLELTDMPDTKTHNWPLYARSYLYSGVRYGAKTLVLQSPSYARFLENKGFKVSVDLPSQHEEFEFIVLDNVKNPGDVVRIFEYLERGGVLAVGFTPRRDLKALVEQIVPAIHGYVLGTGEYSRKRNPKRAVLFFKKYRW